jgi:hypothetical protein
MTTVYRAALCTAIAAAAAVMIAVAVTRCLTLFAHTDVHYWAAVTLSVAACFQTDLFFKLELPSRAFSTPLTDS